MTAAQLRAARQHLALTQQQLADALEVHRVTIAKWETGAEPIPRLAELAVAALETYIRRGRPRAPLKTPRKQAPQ